MMEEKTMKAKDGLKFLLLASTAVWAAPMHAQDTGDNAQAEEQENRFEEKKLQTIVVTGTGREQVATEIPMNITAIGEAELRRKNITDVKQLIAESVEISSPGNDNRNAESVTVRGLNVSPVNNNNLEQFIRTTIAYYLDDTPLPNIAYRIKDIDRVETLLGPQGTLYGANSLGGTIRYITNQPELGEFSANLNSSVYQVKDGELSYDLDGVVNIPVAETLAIRASLAYLDDGGFTDRIANPVFFEGAELRIPQPNPNQNLYKNDDGEETISGKVAVLWQPTDRLGFTFSHVQQDQDVFGTRGASRLPVAEACALEGLTGAACSDRFPNRFSTPFQVNDNTIVSTYNEFGNREFTLDSLVVDWEFDNFDVRSSTSYFDDERTGQSDYLGQGLVFYGFIPGLGLTQTTESAFIETSNSYSGLNHETRISSTHEGPLQWIAGVYHTDSERRLKFSEFYPGFDAAAGASFLAFDRVAQYSDTRLGEIDEGYHENFLNEFTETALFGELTYSVTDRLDLTAGARAFTYEDKSDRRVVDYTGISNSSSNAETSGDEVIFKLNAAYDLSDTVLAYATYSQGFRRGGANGFRDDTIVDDNGDTVPFLVAESSQNFDPDKTNNYEIGIKGEFFDESLYLQANVYQIDWDNAQTYLSQIIDVFFPINGSTNGPSARSQGFELNSRWQATDEWSFRYAAATTSAEWTESLERCIFAPVATAPNANLQCTTWEDGGDLGGAPDWRHNFGVTYERDIAGGLFAANLDGRFVGETPNNTQTALDQDIYVRDSYTTFSASLNYARDDWRVSLWAENLTDELAEISGQFTAQGERAIFVRPRTIGVNLSYAFE
jgi:outer membrane receptor protein involved in Fe transport